MAGAVPCVPARPGPASDSPSARTLLPHLLERRPGLLAIPLAVEKLRDVVHLGANPAAKAVPQAGIAGELYRQLDIGVAVPRDQLVELHCAEQGGCHERAEGRAVLDHCWLPQLEWIQQRRGAAERKGVEINIPQPQALQDVRPIGGGVEDDEAT